MDDVVKFGFELFAFVFCFCGSVVTVIGTVALAKVLVNDFRKINRSVK